MMFKVPSYPNRSGSVISVLPFTGVEHENIIF